VYVYVYEYEYLYCLDYQCQQQKQKMYTTSNHDYNSNKQKLATVVQDYRVPGLSKNSLANAKNFFAKKLYRKLQLYQNISYDSIYSVEYFCAISFQKFLSYHVIHQSED
jgi:hypothetical protein